jgi:hypothetical protein
MALVSEEKIAALDILYARISRAAEAMGGKAAPRLAAIAFRGAEFAIPQTEAVNALLVEMPDGLRVELIPAHPLSIGNVVSVRAERRHAGGRKNDWAFNFVNGEWRATQSPLSDDEIRKCLTPEGPPPIYERGPRGSSRS